MMEARISTEEFLGAITDWAATQSDVYAVALVGSHARGAAKVDSDIDLVLLVADPGKFLADTVWPDQFGKVVRRRVESYGLVTSLRQWYDGGREVEYGFTTPQWVALPLDEGTRQVMQGGIRILFERGKALSRALCG
jgi:predicted nucleotidyltransferase